MQAWFAPDGRHVAYWAQTSDGWDLTVAGPDLEAARVVGTSADCCGPRPVWSPDGRAIAYPSGVQAGINVWLARTDGEAPRQLTQGAGFAGPWQWHPHGGRLVYFRSEAGGVAARFLDIATGASDVLPGTERGDLRIGWWSPDGTHIAYTV
ncbi:MAG TPA: hypothetical protein VFH97_00040, partial [Gemmatimonadales bacterium]|nr:hypothetical protein [Gemmatimonadales bacterium]